MSEAEPFDRALRRRRRQRALADARVPDFLIAHMCEELCERLATVKRSFGDVLELGDTGGRMRGAIDPAAHVVADIAFGTAAPALGVICDEDRLPFADASFDLIIAAGTLHGVNDLPGMLALARRILRPDGLLLAAFAGGRSLEVLRGVMLAADMATSDAAAPRVHPTVDVKAAGSLLQRAGFTLPVVDSEKLDLRYPDIFTLFKDLRTAGEGNCLSHRTPLSRGALASAAERFAQAADADGRTTETVEIVYLTGWAPHPDQPKPLRPGSARVSLVDALSDKS